mgnify:CR=1 FL=1
MRPRSRISASSSGFIPDCRIIGVSLDEIARMFAPDGRPRIDRRVLAAKAEELDGTIRKLTAVDVSAALELSEQAGWNQLEADWRRMLELEPEGCFGVEADGRVAASATVRSAAASVASSGKTATPTLAVGR